MISLYFPTKPNPREVKHYLFTPGVSKYSYPWWKTIAMCYLFQIMVYLPLRKFINNKRNARLSDIHLHRWSPRKGMLMLACRQTYTATKGLVWSVVQARFNSQLTECKWHKQWDGDAKILASRVEYKKNSRSP